MEEKCVAAEKELKKEKQMASNQAYTRTKK